MESYSITKDTLKEAMDAGGWDASSGAWGNKVPAIKVVRHATGCGLKESKDFVEHGLVDMWHSGVPSMVVCGQAWELSYTASLEGLISLLIKVADIAQELREKGVL